MDLIKWISLLISALMAFQIGSANENDNKEMEEAKAKDQKNLCSNPNPPPSCGNPDDRDKYAI